MKVFEGDNFSRIYYEMLDYAMSSDVPISESRVAPVRDLGPAYVEICGNDQRLVYLNGRRINPFFAITEASWILSGSKRLEPLRHFLAEYGQFSDDNETLNGAYGFRLRKHFGVDQIESSIDLLRRDPATRRIVLTTWTSSDLGANSNDVPCNTMLYLKIRNGKLDITVLNRSNDLYLGIPYNVFAFHVIQNYFCMRTGLALGTQRHFTDSLHLYERDFESATRILASNDLANLSLPRERLQPFDIASYVGADHDIIVDLRFDEINEATLRDLFKAYEARNSSEPREVLALLPRNLLGFVAYQWFRGKPGFVVGSEIELYEELIRGMA